MLLVHILFWAFHISSFYLLYLLRLGSLASWPCPTLGFLYLYILLINTVGGPLLPFVTWYQSPCASSSRSWPHVRASQSAAWLSPSCFANPAPKPASALRPPIELPRCPAAFTQPVVWFAALTLHPAPCSAGGPVVLPPRLCFCFWFPCSELPSAAFSLSATAQQRLVIRLAPSRPPPLVDRVTTSGVSNLSPLLLLLWLLLSLFRTYQRWIFNLLV